MNHTENVVVSPHLLAERDRLLTAISTVQQSGSVAPAHCWLTESSETKNGRVYTYARLVTDKPGKRVTSTSLGKPGSDKHRAWQTALARRDAIAELEQQLKQVEGLLDRQAAGARWLNAVAIWARQSTNSPASS